MIERRSGAAVLRFRSAGQGLYSIDLQGEQTATGAEIKQSINDAFAWMFINADALMLRGEIAVENKQCLALAPHVPGYRLEYGAGIQGRHVFTLTLARWAKAYGIEKALSEMRSAGQGAKADKLEAAAMAAGVL